LKLLFYRLGLWFYLPDESSRPKGFAGFLDHKRYKTGAVINETIIEEERQRDFQLTRAKRFRHRTRYVTDAGIIGGKVFVTETYRKVIASFHYKKRENPHADQGA
jgi:hypothetical protein